MIYITFSFVILNSVLGLNIAGLVATSGVIAIVVGLALQNTLADVFSGIAVSLEQPFHVGDRVSLGDNVEGTIVQTNDAWAAAVRSQPDAEVSLKVGANYLDACRKAIGMPPDVGRALQASIESVLRAERDWSQADLAERLEVSRQTINALETGKYDPSLPLAFRIARLFEQPIEAIFDDGEG